MLKRRLAGVVMAVGSMSVAAAMLGAQGTALPLIPLDKVRRSQEAMVMQRVANTDLTITYSRPSARGRELFGALVPWGRVWHPGADQATALAITRDITMADQALAAGNYSLWTIPTPETWTIIFSSAADVFHTPYPGQTRDVLRLTVTPEAVPHTELLTWDFPLVDGKSTTLRLRWGTVAVSMPVIVP